MPFFRLSSGEFAFMGLLLCHGPLGWMPSEWADRQKNQILLLHLVSPGGYGLRCRSFLSSNILVHLECLQGDGERVGWSRFTDSPVPALFQNSWFYTNGKNTSRYDRQSYCSSSSRSSPQKRMDYRITWGYTMKTANYFYVSYSVFSFPFPFLFCTISLFLFHIQGANVTVIGASGGIGQPLSLLLKMNRFVKRLSLYDRSKPPGVAVDLSHINTPCHVMGVRGEANLSQALNGSDIVIITAGVPRKPGMCRDDLFVKNAQLSVQLASSCAQ